MSAAEQHPGLVAHAEARGQSLQNRIADRITAFAGSMLFVYIHIVWFALWIGFRVEAFPFGLLTMIVSLEAIFLSIFILMAQKRESAIAELREELGLQVTLRIEEEMTKTLQLMTGLYTRLGHVMGEDPELHDMLGPLDIASIERELLEQIAAAAATRRGKAGRRSGDLRAEPAPQAIVELASLAAEHDREVLRDTAFGADDVSEAAATGRWFGGRWFSSGFFSRRRRGDSDQSGADRRVPPDDY